MDGYIRGESNSSYYPRLESLREAQRRELMREIERFTSVTELKFLVSNQNGQRFKIFLPWYIFSKKT